MTAFARNRRELGWGTISCEIRSLNHRFLETSFRLPESFRQTENSLREIARAKLQRGKIDCTIQLTLTENENLLQANIPLARRYIDVAEKLSNEIQNPAPISALEVMRWPGIIIDKDLNTDKVEEEVLELFTNTIGQLLEGRAREGEKLTEMILLRLLNMEEQIRKIKINLPKILESQRTRLKDRLTQIKQDLDNDRVEQEMVLVANRTDVNEELERLEAHIFEVRRTLKSKEAIGRRLDFLMQELNRESNTLGSKSIAGVTTQASIELKVSIEQMREQIQNIE
ncbi:MAG: YicC family protein [Porticoccaceae bacterium]|nr:YicC family protein [Porticoccaceae bacterium]|tara:strand:+ start:1321 stop:2172 length:852 start_codon:yes stop_codon:yes gene_type:complete